MPPSKKLRISSGSATCRPSRSWSISRPSSIEPHVAGCRHRNTAADAGHRAADGCAAHRNFLVGPLLPDVLTETPDLDQAMSLSALFPSVLADILPLAPGTRAGASRKRDMNTAQSYLYQLFGTEPEERHWKPLQTYLILLADHGMNASTFTARVIASTQSDIVSALTGAVGALKGPLHGGAPSKVLDMLNEIGTAENVDPWLNAAFDRGDRLMGFGHRVYKAEDPRAEILREMARTASDPDFFELSLQTETRALEMLNERKPGRRLYTNVEFYSAAVLAAVGLPGDMFTPTFAVSRSVGWSAHVLEQVSNNRLIRPQSEFVGELGKTYVPVDGSISLHSRTRLAERPGQSLRPFLCISC